MQHHDSTEHCHTPARCAGAVLVAKLRRENRLLIKVKFSFTFSYSPLPYKCELEAFLRRWPAELSCLHPDINALVVYQGRSEEHPWFEDYEGHDASPSLLVTSTISARLLTMTSEEEES